MRTYITGMHTHAHEQYYWYIIHDVCKPIAKGYNMIITRKTCDSDKQFSIVTMISEDMPNFRVLVAMVAEFASFHILHHNTLMGVITISST